MPDAADAAPPTTGQVADNAAETSDARAYPSAGLRRFSPFVRLPQGDAVVLVNLARVDTIAAGSDGQSVVRFAAAPVGQPPLVVDIDFDDIARELAGDLDD